MAPADAVSGPAAASCCGPLAPATAAEHACCGPAAPTGAAGPRPSPSPAAAAAGCCAPAAPQLDCCAPATGTTARARPDWLLRISGVIVGGCVFASLLLGEALHGLPVLGPFAHAVHAIALTMWWGLAFGVVMTALLARVPRELVIAALGPPGPRGVLRASLAGVALDLCSHGILMVAARLYERGASSGQVMAFLIASPWNSLSLTLVLVALMGLPWTLAFIGFSLVIAIVTGLAFDALVARGRLPDNPHRRDLPADFAPATELRRLLGSVRVTPRGVAGLLVEGLRESRMVMRWLLFGIVAAALIRVLVDGAVFADWFGPTVLGLFLTLVAATLIEVCSEGSVPIAADLLTRAHAPGNAFAFLMAGVATDYTEVLVLRETTRSWRVALALPLLSVPQIVLIGYLINHAAS